MVSLKLNSEKHKQKEKGEKKTTSSPIQLTKRKGGKTSLVSNSVNKESNNFEEILCPDFIKSSVL